MERVFGRQKTTHRGSSKFALYISCLHRRVQTICIQYTAELGSCDEAFPLALLVGAAGSCTHQRPSGKHHLQLYGFGYPLVIRAMSKSQELASVTMLSSNHPSDRSIRSCTELERQVNTPLLSAQVWATEILLVVMLHAVRSTLCRCTALHVPRL